MHDVKTQCARFDSLYGDLWDFACAYASALEANQALEQLARKLPRCSARTDSGFILWACKIICRECCFPFDVVEVQRHFELSMQQLLAEKPARKAGKPFECAFNGDNVLVKLTAADGSPVVWSFPDTWLDYARALWPVHVRADRDGYFVARKAAGQIVRLHRVFVGADDAESVRAKDGSFLNYCDGNLYIVKNQTAQQAFEDSMTQFPEHKGKDGDPLPFEIHYEIN